MAEHSRVTNSITRAFSRSSQQYETFAQVQNQSAAVLSEFLRQELPHIPERVLELGAGTGLFSRRLASRFPEARLTVTDISKAMLSVNRRLFANISLPMPEFQLLDMNKLDEDQSFDLVASNMSIHWANDPQDLILRIADVLDFGGKLAFSVPLADSFPVWREVCLKTDVPYTGNKLPSLQEWTDWLADAGFSVKRKQSRIEMYFSDVLDMLTNFKRTGASSVNHEKRLSVSQFRKLAAGSPAPFEDRFEVGYFIAKKV